MRKKNHLPFSRFPAFSFSASSALQRYFSRVSHLTIDTHAAPLGLNAAQFAVRHHRKGLVSKPDGLGNPTPTGSIVRPDPTSRSAGVQGLDMSPIYRHHAPLEREADRITGY